METTTKPSVGNKVALRSAEQLEVILIDNNFNKGVAATLALQLAEQIVTVDHTTEETFAFCDKHGIKYQMPYEVIERIEESEKVQDLIDKAIDDLEEKKLSPEMETRRKELISEAENFHLCPDCEARTKVLEDKLAAFQSEAFGDRNNVTV